MHDLKSQQVERRFVEVSKQLEDSAFEASDLAQPAEELGLKVQTTEAFGREGGAEGLTANRQVLQAAFSPEILEDGRNSSVIELDPNTVVVVHLKEHKKSQQLTLEQVADSIRVQLAHVRATDAAKAQGDELIAAMSEGKTPVEEAGEGGWKVVEAATRNQEGVEPVVVQSVFRMPKPADSNKPNYAGVSLDNGDYVVIRLNGVASPSEPLTAEEKAAYARFLGSRAGQEDFAAFRKQLEAKADIERF